eukprot:jgi/Mesvir1/19799/Mv13091-RA.1
MAKGDKKPATTITPIIKPIASTGVVVPKPSAIAPPNPVPVPITAPPKPVSAPTNSGSITYDDNNPLHVVYKKGLFQSWTNQKLNVASFKQADLDKYMNNIRNDKGAAFTDADFALLKRQWENPTTNILPSKPIPVAPGRYIPGTPIQEEYKAKLIGSWKAIQVKNTPDTQKAASVLESQARKLAYFNDTDINNFKKQVGVVPPPVEPAPTVLSSAWVVNPVVAPPPPAPTSQPAPAAPVATVQTTASSPMMGAAITGAQLTQLQQALGGINTALSSAGITKNSERKNKVLEIFGDPRAANIKFKVTRDRSTGDWTAKEILSYLTKATFPDILTNGYVPKNNAYVTDWQTTGTGGEKLAKFTVQWRSSDKGYLYETVVDVASIIPLSSTTAHTPTIPTPSSIAVPKPLFGTTPPTMTIAPPNVIVVPKPPGGAPKPPDGSSSNMFMIDIKARDRLVAAWRRCGMDTANQQNLDCATLAENDAMRDNGWDFKTIEFLRGEFKKMLEHEKTTDNYTKGMYALHVGRLKDAKAFLGKTDDKQIAELFVKKAEEIKAKIREYIAQRNLEGADNLVKFAMDQEVIVGAEGQDYFQTFLVLSYGKELKTQFESDITRLVELWNAKNFSDAFTLEAKIDTPPQKFASLGKEKSDVTEIDAIAKPLVTEIKGYIPANKEPALTKAGLGIDKRRSLIVDQIKEFDKANQRDKGDQLKQLALKVGYFANSNGLDQMTYISTGAAGSTPPSQPAPPPTEPTQPAPPSTEPTQPAPPSTEPTPTARSPSEPATLLDIPVFSKESKMMMASLGGFAGLLFLVLIIVMARKSK